MIVLGKDRILGTVGGGLAEAYVIDQAVECLASGQSRLVEYTLDGGTSHTSIAMSCGGDLQVFIEVITPRPELLIVGGGHVALQIARMAAMLDFSIAVADSRPEFPTPERFPMARRLFSRPDIREALKEAEIDGNTSIVICTGSQDEEVLREVVSSPAAYIGLLGSRRKISLIARKLASEGVDPLKLAAVHAPIGLDLKAETPEEIALSILGEIRMVIAGSTGRPMSRRYDNLAVVRGGGDIASGTIARLVNAGYRVAVLEIGRPTLIRSTVSFARAIYDGKVLLEGITAEKAESLEQVFEILDRGNVPVAEDPEGAMIPALKPAAVVDAILAKKNLGTTRDMAPAVIGLGPGFEAGRDVDAVIETNRGHNLGRVILSGPAEPNTGVPGVIGGEGEKRVVRAPAAGAVEARKAIGDTVRKGDLLALVGGVEVRSELDGVLRGLIREGLEVTPGFKIGDVDPRGQKESCYTISDKARAVAGGVLEALLTLSLPKRR